MPDPGLHEQLEQIAVDWCKSQVHAVAVQTVNELAAALNTTAGTPADAYTLVRMVAGIRQANRSLRHQVTAAHEELAAVLHDHGVEVTHLPGLAQVVDRAVNRIKTDAQIVRQLDHDRNKATRQRDKAIDDANDLRDEAERANTVTARLVERTAERDRWKQRTARLAETLEDILNGFGKVNSTDSSRCMRGSVPQATVTRWRKVLAEQGNPAIPVRCHSCDHLWDHHRNEGCWYTVSAGSLGQNLTCPCTAVNPANSETAGPAMSHNRPDSDTSRVPCPTCGIPCRYTAFGGGEAYCEPCGNEFRPELAGPVNTLTQPADSNTRVEWGVCVTSPDGSSNYVVHDSEADARAVVARDNSVFAEAFPDHTSTLVRRPVGEWETVPEGVARNEADQ